MKIAIIQCDVRAGDIRGNAEILASLAKQCDGADLCVAPGLALSGPLAPCVFNMPDFRAALVKGEADLARQIETMPPLVYGGADGCRLLQNGTAIAPQGDFFLHGSRIRCLAPDGKDKPREGQADIVCWPAAIPFVGKEMDLAPMRALAEKNRAWLVMANLYGGYDGVIYPGGSLILDSIGRLRAAAPLFAESVLVADGQADFSLCEMPKWNRLEAVLDALVLGLRDFVRKCGARSVLLGLSGGMDSALVAALAVEALGAKNVTGLIMPSPFSSAGSVTDSVELAENLGIESMELPIGELMKGFDAALAPVYEHFAPQSGDVTGQNIQARIRGMLLSAASNRSGALVLNTGNKSEAAMGYFTLYGDSAGALAVLGDLYKTEVYEIAALINEKAGKKLIPQNIFDKAPSAELAPDQKDSDSLPPYCELDAALRKLPESLAGDEKAIEARQRLFGAEFKRRQCPPALVVSENPLGGCLRPIAGKVDFGG